MFSKKMIMTSFVLTLMAIINIFPIYAANKAPIDLSSQIKSKSVILMEQSTGEVLYEQNSDQKLAPASITKVMTLLLVMEALDDGKISLTDVVTCSPTANSMGGSQIWLMVGEQMTVDDLLKAVAVGSANDAAVALGEHIAGSEQGFIDMMNNRAVELGMTNTTLKNITGLDQEGHLTTARDIAIMSRALMEHEQIKNYTTIWMDSLRGGKTALVNTNKLVRFYSGATGLKTGTTANAGSCLSATATNNGLSLVAVTLGSTTGDERFATARALLDYGFSNFSFANPPDISAELSPMKIKNGVSEYVNLIALAPKGVIVKKGMEKKFNQTITLEQDVKAPITQGQVLGKVSVDIDGKEILSYDIVADSAVDKISFFKAFSMLIDGAL